MFATTPEQPWGLNPEVSDLLFVTVDDGDAVLGLDGVVGLLLGFSLLLASSLTFLRDLRQKKKLKII